MPQVYPGIQSGGRTRHIINMASPGNEEELAYTFTEATDAPSAATAGYKNPGLQKNIARIADEQQRWNMQISSLGLPLLCQKVGGTTDYRSRRWRQ